MHILFCLRYLRLRTLKERVLSLLNFQRSVERKLVLDEAPSNLDFMHALTECGGVCVCFLVCLRLMTVLAPDSNRCAQGSTSRRWS